MANDPKNYRDPKVTEDRGGIGRWLLIGLAVLLALLLLGWLLGLIGGDDDAVVVTDDQPDAVVVTPEDPDAVVVTD